MAAVSDRPTDSAERLRLGAAESQSAAHRARLGQFFTPIPVARLVASMLVAPAAGRVRLLDPGAGVGSLTAAALERFATLGVRELEVVAWEIDAGLHPQLRDTLGRCVAWGAEQGVSVRWELRGGDYVQATAEALAGGDDDLGDFDAIVMNPPYRKVNGDAGERHALERIGLPITNLYTAFLALAASQLVPDGVLAAITPRSFANGCYSAPFRHFFFELVGIERLHLFESRADAFADSGVLQENVIFSVRRGMNPETVQVSFSRGIEDEPRALKVPSEEIVRSDDPDLFLRIPSDEDDAEIAGAMSALPSSLEDLGIAVSTGRVVEFRAREHLRITPGPGTAPLAGSGLEGKAERARRRSDVGEAAASQWDLRPREAVDGQGGAQTRPRGGLRPVGGAGASDRFREPPERLSPGQRGPASRLGPGIGCLPELLHGRPLRSPVQRPHPDQCLRSTPSPVPERRCPGPPRSGGIA
jgi:adenine-specific DNA-methyltransferase